MQHRHVSTIACTLLLAATAAQAAGPTASTCAADNTGITVPAGFCATVFADNVGHSRHLVDCA